MPETRYNLIVELDEDGLRLDRFLALMLTAQSRSYLQKLIKQGNVLVNGKRQKPASLVKTDDRVDAVLPEPVPLEVNPEPIPLDIIYEDTSLLVLNKSAGITVHPSANNLVHTLVNALLYHCGPSLSGIGGVLRPGIVHRLDKDTSGCLVIAKDDITHNDLSMQFRKRKILKEYFAVVNGRLKRANGRIEFAVGRHPAHRKRMAVRFDKGKEAVTEYEVLERFKKAAFLRIKMGTGRTHQIRVHMAYIGHPILGDREYGRRKAYVPGIEIPRHMLHAHRLGFTHPAAGRWMEFTAPVPQDMQDVLDMLGRS